LTQARRVAYPCVDHPAWHPAEIPESLWRGTHARGVLPLGDGCPPGRRGGDTRTTPAASPGQGHARAGAGLPTPCRREDCLHVSRPLSTGAAGGFVNVRQPLSTLSGWGHAIGRWPGFESRQGGWNRAAFGARRWSSCAAIRSPRQPAGFSGRLRAGDTAGDRLTGAPD
jgi:hypothetical protein